VSEGYLYITCTRKLLAEAAMSSRSIRAVKPDAHITLFTNKLEDVPADHAFDDIQIKPMEKQKSLMEGFMGRFSSFMRLPYHKTLFLDSDTYICEDPSGPFRLLDFFDILQVPAPGESLAREMDPPYDKIPGTSMYNCGVIFFKNSPLTQEMFADWRDIYMNQNPGKTWLKDKVRFREQHPYFQAFLRSICRMHALNPIWNFRVGSHLSLKGKVKIIHGRGVKRQERRKFLKVPFTEKQFRQLRDLVNVTEDVRLWNPRTRQIIKKGDTYGEDKSA